MQTEKDLKPISFWPSLLYFGITSLIIILLFYRLWLDLIQTGVTPIVSYFLMFYGSLSLLLITHG